MKHSLDQILQYLAKEEEYAAFDLYRSLALRRLCVTRNDMQFVDDSKILISYVESTVLRLEARQLRYYRHVKSNGHLRKTVFTQSDLYSPHIIVVLGVTQQRIAKLAERIKVLFSREYPAGEVVRIPMSCVDTNPQKFFKQLRRNVLKKLFNVAPVIIIEGTANTLEDVTVASTFFTNFFSAMWPTSIDIFHAFAPLRQVIEDLEQSIIDPYCVSGWRFPFYHLASVKDQVAGYKTGEKAYVEELIKNRDQRVLASGPHFTPILLGTLYANERAQTDWIDAEVSRDFLTLLKWAENKANNFGTNYVYLPTIAQEG